MVLLLCGFLLACSGAESSQSQPVRPHHDLRITLIPEESRLVGVDTIRIFTGEVPGLTFYLAEQAAMKKVSLNGRSRDYTFRQGALSIPLNSDEQGRDILLEIRYEAVFNDPVPVKPVNMDNPGFGVSGTISDRGVLLLGGSGWYPYTPAESSTYRIEVDAPPGITSVTAGKSLGSENRNGRTVSTWQVDDPVDFLALSAGRYEVMEKSVAGATVATYFFPETASLAPDYLEASARYIALYADLFGPYPFDKFAVVENFFPTGYGFPSYTLLGSRVIRLPFIIHTSLGHEIAHCWWGNGVQVDYDGGNWSEGLTTYVSDYLYKERESLAAGREYRIQMLRNYASLVNPEEDIPLTRFKGRIDPVTKAVGYDKAAMVFHMLRRRVGDDLFWEGLGRIYRENLFQPISWKDFQGTFEAMAETPFEEFFDQWVSETGAARLSLADVTLTKNDGGYRIAGILMQDKPVFDLNVPVAVETAAGKMTEVLRSNRAATKFEISVDNYPRSLILDPNADLFRRLYPSEIPPSVNSLKGAESVLVVLTKNSSSESAETADLLIRSLGLDRARIIREDALTEPAAEKNDLIFIGVPEKDRFLAGMPKTVSVRKDGFSLNDRFYEYPSSGFFGVFQHSRSNGKVAALFLAQGPSAEIAARKITHYGKYSYLAFTGGVNQDKGAWPVTDSPLIHHFTGPAS
ncbi:MAG: M1 family metallopeptidase [Thermodesulfobacteriota bacterium]